MEILPDSCSERSGPLEIQQVVADPLPVEPGRVDQMKGERIVVYVEVVPLKPKYAYGLKHALRLCETDRGDTLTLLHVLSLFKKNPAIGRGAVPLGPGVREALEACLMEHEQRAQLSLEELKKVLCDTQNIDAEISIVPCGASDVKTTLLSILREMKATKVIMEMTIQKWPISAKSAIVDSFCKEEVPCEVVVIGKDRVVGTYVPQLAASSKDCSTDLPSDASTGPDLSSCLSKDSTNGNGSEDDDAGTVHSHALSHSFTPSVSRLYAPSSTKQIQVQQGQDGKVPQAPLSESSSSAGEIQQKPAAVESTGDTFNQLLTNFLEKLPWSKLGSQTEPRTEARGTPACSNSTRTWSLCSPTTAPHSTAAAPDLSLSDAADVQPSDPSTLNSEPSTSAIRLPLEGPGLHPCSPSLAENPASAGDKLTVQTTTVSSGCITSSHSSNAEGHLPEINRGEEYECLADGDNEESVAGRISPCHDAEVQATPIRVVPDGVAREMMEPQKDVIDVQMVISNAVNAVRFLPDVVADLPILDNSGEEEAGEVGSCSQHRTEVLECVAEEEDVVPREEGLHGALSSSSSQSSLVSLPVSSSLSSSSSPSLLLPSSLLSSSSLLSPSSLLPSSSSSSLSSSSLLLPLSSSSSPSLLLPSSLSASPLLPSSLSPSLVPSSSSSSSVSSLLQDDRYHLHANTGLNQANDRQGKGCTLSGSSYGRSWTTKSLGYLQLALLEEIRPLELKNRKLTEELSRLQVELQQVKLNGERVWSEVADKEEKYQKRIDELEAALRDIKVRFKDKERHCEMLLKMLKDVESHKQEAEAKAVHEEERRTNLERGLEKAQKSLEDVVRTVGEFRRKEEVLRRELDQARKFIEEEKRRVTEIDAYRNDEATRRAILEIQLQNLQDEVNEKTAALDCAPRPLCEFSYEELQQATDDFSNSRKLGESRFGATYAGEMQIGLVAVKILRSGWDQDLSCEELRKEVETLSCIHHPNLVMLLGACIERRCLVYEFMNNSSLQDHLSGRSNMDSLPWHVRFRIAAEIARTLHFLHTCLHEPVVHRDLKPANIFLDKNYVSKIGNLGLNRLMPQAVAESYAMHHAMQPQPVLLRAFAYVDPEYFVTRTLVPQSDIYSLGIIILQLLTGKNSPEVSGSMQLAIADNQLESILDRSAGRWNLDQAEKVALLALKCAEVRRRNRPDLQTQILPVLEMVSKLADEEAAADVSTRHVGIPAEAVATMFMCPITQDIMENPVVAADGHTYERSAIESWLQTHQTSPMTNLVMPHKNLIPNHSLRSSIAEWRQLWRVSSQHD